MDIVGLGGWEGWQLGAGEGLGKAWLQERLQPCAFRFLRATAT
jgi:hypothetical protein